MPSILKFTPLSGALSDTPLCYLLDWDGFRILLDCGWNDAFDPDVLAPLQRYGPQKPLAAPLRVRPKSS